MKSVLIFFWTFLCKSFLDLFLFWLHKNESTRINGRFKKNFPQYEPSTTNWNVKHKLTRNVLHFNFFTIIITCLYLAICYSCLQFVCLLQFTMLYIWIFFLIHSFWRSLNLFYVPAFLTSIHISGSFLRPLYSHTFTFKFHDAFIFRKT